MSGSALTGAIESPSLQKIRELLGGLRRNSVGQLIFQQIEQILVDTFQEYVETERAYAALLGVLLDGIAQQIPSNDTTRLQIRLVQRRLIPPLLRSELRSLQQYATEWNSRLSDMGPAGTQIMLQALDPLVRDLTGVGISGVEDTTVLEPHDESPPRGHTQGTNNVILERKVDLAYRHHLDEQTKDVQKLQAELARQIRDTMQRQEEFGVLLEVASSELKDIDDGDNIGEIKALLLRQIEQLLTGHRGLSGHLEKTYQALGKIAHDSRQLSDELQRVRLLSLTDELTDLPNRRAFQRRLQDEAGRVSRYGYPLTLAVIDLDKFKDINDAHGHAAGDQVLVSYSKHILSVFRHHDMVSRYGGEEFAVLFPNTDLKGASRALEKVQERLRGIVVHANEVDLSLPTFSAGLAQYHPGETADDFIGRADAALYSAKRKGRNRVEIADGDKPGAQTLNPGPSQVILKEKETAR